MINSKILKKKYRQTFYKTKKRPISPGGHFNYYVPRIDKFLYFLQPEISLLHNHLHNTHFMLQVDLRWLKQYKMKHIFVLIILQAYTKTGTKLCHLK